MAITKNIVEMMGGRITVNSRKGEGTEFVLTVNFRIADKNTSDPAIPELKGQRSLVVDDDVNACQSIADMLREVGMRSEWCVSGKEAVIRTEESLRHGDRFKVCIIDLLMPDMNGIETVRRIRKVIGDDAPIIILTAYDWADIEAEAREAGVTAFCSKPLFMSELRDVLTQPFLSSKDEQAEKKKSEQEELPDFTGKRVLLAEDNSMNQMIAEAILTNVGLEVEFAGDGTEAVEKMESVPAGYYDMILMDIQMPKMNGYEATKQIRAMEDKAKAEIPIVAVTANVFDEDDLGGMKGN